MHVYAAFYGSDLMGVFALETFPNATVEEYDFDGDEISDYGSWTATIERKRVEQ